MFVRLRVLLLLPILLLALAGPAARAEDFDLPGIQRPTERYFEGLTSRFPAGAPAAARRAAEQQAAAAIAKRDWAAAVAALELRIAQGDASAAQYADLANAFLRRTPPDAERALYAGWQAFQAADAGEAEIRPLLLIAEALRAQKRMAPMMQALAQVVERAPDNAEYRRQLEAARREVGVQVSRVRTEAEADPARACLAFTSPPSRRADFNPQDWIRLDPPVPGAAVTREGDQICISGLPYGATTRITVRAGMPGEGGLEVAVDNVGSVAIPNRQPRVAFDTRMFVLPRGQAPAVSLTTVNVSAVSLSLVRMTERNVAGFLRDYRMGEPIDRWAVESIAESSGSEVWKGSAEIARWEVNKPARTALPMPEALASAGPGLYALVAAVGDGSPRRGSTAVQMILRTDLAPTVWRGSDGLTVQVRGYSDALPRASVMLRLLARNNDILAEVTTGPDGVGRFPRALLRGEGGLEPGAIHAFSGTDFASLDLNSAAFDLSDRGVEGMAHPGPLDAFVWFDRGIYRPGETVQLMALVRDAAGLPADLPVSVTVKRPGGQTFLKVTPPRLAEAAIHLPVTLSAGASAGIWTVELHADPGLPPIGRGEFRVDAFVPDRMAVEVGALPAALVAGQPASVKVSARFLYGAPAAGLSGEATLRLVADPAPFAALAGYRIGQLGEIYAPGARQIELPETDPQGATTLALNIARLPDTTFALKAELEIAVNDPAGRASRTTASIPVRPDGPLIGIKPLFPDNAVDAQAEAGFDIAAVGPDGARIALPAKLRLVRERPDWRMVMRGSLARYETVWRDEPLETRDIAIPADAPLRFAKKLDFGRYRLEVAQDGGMAITSLRFRAGWASSESPDVPDRVDVSAATRSARVGETVKIHIAPPFAGQATIAVLSDHVLSLRNVTVAEAGTDVEVPVEAGWGPGAYVAVHVFRGGTDTTRPARAIGLAWVGVDPAARTLAVAIETPERLAPRTRSIVPVRVAPGAWVTLAAVDEGILRLTRFATPNPAAHYLGQRRLGLDIRDDWGRLIAPAEGEATLLKQGGDEGGFVLPDIPLRTVTLFGPPVQAGADGVAQVPLDMPDFNGEVRLMAVAWHGSKVGSAGRAATVRDPVVAEALLPRFLAPGDEARLAVMLHNIDLPAGMVRVEVTTEGPLEVQGGASLSANLAPGERGLPATLLRATGAGRGVVKLAITAPGGFSLQRDTAITIRPARPPSSLVSGSEMAAGAVLALEPPIARFMPGTWTAEATFGAAVRYDAGALVRALEAYPLSCLEQTVSRGLPLALLPDGPVAGEQRTARLGAAVAAVLDRQRYDGGFGMWSAGGEAEGWLSAYAVEFLLRARAAGATVPEVAMADALRHLAEASEYPSDKPEPMAAQAYRLYVLALAGQGRPGAARVLAENPAALPTPLARAQVAAALALAHDQPRAEAMFVAALDSPVRRWWAADYGTGLRDLAAMVVLLKESGLLPVRLTRLVAGLPGGDLLPDALSTQEQGWMAAAAAVLGRDGRPVRVALDATTLSGPVVAARLSGPASARNLSERAVWQSVAVSGVPLEALPAARAGMRVSRKFLALDGSTLNLDQLRQNTEFVLLLEGAAETRQAHRALVMQGLPAGWEITARLPAGSV
ncbi:MAG: alpha-2-macroglobulin family protein, partial [Acetobacteraceae bacterium]|nr:alpha-2-macroglobulin family protein [Acetobacteraceae bacterium]